MARPTMTDLARAANVSLSTVDRVLNGRDPVRRDKAERVLAAAAAIGFRATGLLRQRLGAVRPERAFGFVLQQQADPFYRSLGEELARATREEPAVRGQARVDFSADVATGAVIDTLMKAARSVDALALVAADHPKLTQAIDELRARGIPVLALISDLTAQSRAGYVGLDNWKVGRTAAWAIANLCRRGGKVSISLGSHRYICQETSEVSFRSYFREHAPALDVLGATTSFEEPRFAYENTRDLLRRHPDLAGLYVAGGGLEGVLEALKETGAGRSVISIGRELTPASRSGLIEGLLSLVVAHPLRMLADAAVTALVRATMPAGRDRFQQVIVPISVFTPESL